MRNGLSYLLSVLLLCSSTFTPQYLQAETRRTSDEPETARVFGGLSILLAATARLNTTLFSAVPQLSTILSGQHSALVSQLLGVSGLPFSSFQSMCGTIAGQVTTQLSGVVGPLEQVADIGGQLSGKQSVVSLLPRLTASAGVDTSNMTGLLSQASSLNGALAGGSFNQVLGGLVAGKIASQSQVLSALNGSKGNLDLGALRLGFDNSLLRSIINTSGSHQISQLAAGAIPKMAVLGQIASLDGQISSIANLQGRVSSELLPQMNQLRGLAGSGNLSALATSVTERLSLFNSEQLSVSDELQVISGALGNARQSFDILNALSPLQRIEQFGPVGDQIDAHTRELQATEAFLSEREAQLQTLSQLESQLFSKQNQLQYVQSAIANYTALDGIMTQLPAGEQATALISMLDGYKDSALSSIESLGAAHNVLQQGRELVAQRGAALINGALPIDSVMTQFEEVRGLVLGQATEAFAPLLEGANLFQDQLGNIQGVIGSAFGGVSATIQQGISQITGRLNFLQGGGFLSGIQGQISSLSGTFSTLQSQLQTVIGPLQDVLSDFGSASGLCDAAQAQLSQILDGTNFSQLSGVVNQFFGGIQGQIGGYISSLNGQLLTAIQPLCGGLTIPGLCSGAMYTPTESFSRRLNKKQRKQRKQLKKCCRQFSGAIPQCDEPASLSCIQPDPSMRQVKGKKPKKRAKQCFVVFRKQTRQCIKTFNSNPSISQVPLFPELRDPAAISTPEALAVSIDQVNEYLNQVLEFSRAFPAQGLSLVYSEVYGYDPVALVQSAPQMIQEFLEDERYAEYR